MKTWNELLAEFSILHESIGMLEDLKVFHQYTTTKQYQNILELGILHGNSNRTFAFAASKLPNTYLTAVDIEQGCIDQCAAKTTNDGTRQYVTYIKSDSVKFLHQSNDNYWDCIFIDTDHRLTQTLAEIFLAGLKAKQNGGHIFMHDTGMQEVRDAIEVFKKYKKYKHTRFQTNAGLDLLELTQ